jgi:hypothetical protein
MNRECKHQQAFHSKALQIDEALNICFLTREKN